MGKQAQPGFYRFKLGTIEITVVSDGTLAFPAETLWGDRAEDARGLLTSTFQPSSPVQLQINTILVNTGDKLILIDAGCGVDKFQKTAGGLLGHLPEAMRQLSAISSRCDGPSGGRYGPVRRKPTYQEKSFVVSAFCKPRPAENRKWSCSLKS